MKIGVLNKLLKAGEWNDVEFKGARTAMRRIAMCEQAGTGLRMMREAWRKLGHPSPTYKNDRAGKAFELFIPELDKEVDMASDLVKAMFGDARQTETAQKTDQGAGEKTGERTGKKTRERILDLTRDRPQITAAELAGEIGITVKGIQWNLDRLKRTGALRRIGPDKGGHWEIQKKDR